MPYEAEILDQFQQVLGTSLSNDHQLHCILRFESAIDPDLLEKAFISSIMAVPILGTRYNGGTRPHWAPLDFSSFKRAFVVVRTEAEFEQFVLGRIDEALGPQVKICLHDVNSFAIALKMNHMVSDAAGFKAFLYFLCNIYSNLVANPAYTPPLIMGDRGMCGILDCFDENTKLRALIRKSEEQDIASEELFPFSQTGEIRPFILMRKLKQGREAAIKNYGRAKGATLNDVILAAYYRCLFQVLVLKPGDWLSIPITVNMRRYLKNENEFVSLSNLSSTAITRLEFRPKDSFENTLCRVKAVVGELKRNEIGLNSFLRLYLTYLKFGNENATRLLSKSMKRPKISMTNIGILDSTKLTLGQLRPYDAFLGGSIKYKPYFQLAISSYEGELTLSVSLYGNVGDQNRILSFFDQMEAELPQETSY